MTFFSLISSKISRSLIFVLSGIAAVSGLFYKVYRKGEKSQEQEQKEREYEAQKLRADVAEEVSAMSDRAVTDELRQRLKNDHK